jgi:serine/threonine protein kinase
MSAIADGQTIDLAGRRAVEEQPRRIVDRYRLIEQLGRGGMGRVYRAHDELLDRPVAVKLIYDDAVRDREIQHACAVEARAAARLNHPGIVRVLDSGFDDGHCYVVMSLADGRTLAEIVREAGRLSVDRALDVAIQVADALAAAHAEGVIHCDVKPGNLLVDATGRVRLVDFGIARVASSTTGLTGELLQGSAQYVAPEQIEGAPVDARTDLYGLGTVLYEMLAGQTPFGGGSIASVLARRLVNDPPSLRDTNPDVPVHLERLILRALDRNPDRRFSSAGAMRDALMAARATEHALPVPRRATQIAWRIPSVRTGAVVVAIAGLLLGIGVTKCGVAGVEAETTSATESVASGTERPVAPVLVAAPATVPPPPPTSIPPTLAPPTATVPPPTALPEPTLEQAAPPAQAAPQAVVAAPPPVRAFTAPAPASEPPPAPPADNSNAKPRNDDPKPKPENEERRQPNLSNTPRSDDKTPEERQKAEAKKQEPEKRDDPPKVEMKQQPAPKPGNGNNKKR